MVFARPLLLVDDVPMNLKVLEAMLRKLDVPYLACASGAEALELAAKELPCVILTDLWMPGMNGGELAERLAIKHGSNHVFDYMKLADDYAIYEISVPESWVGKTIVGKAIRQKYQISILATKENGHIYPLPSPDHVFKQNETLMIMGHQKDVQAITK